MHTLGVVSPLDAGKQVANKLDTTESARKLYSVLWALSFDWIDHKAYGVTPSFCTFHSSLTLISAVVGMDRVTAWRSLARLKNLGVVDTRLHKVMFRGRASNSGTVFQVRLDPAQGSKAKLAYHDMRHNWHDLHRAARDKTLVYQTVQRINQETSQFTKYLMLKEHSFKTLNSKPVISSYRLHAGLDALLAVPNSQGKEVHEVVDRGARAMSDALQDAKSLEMYRKLLHALRRRFIASGSNEFYTLRTQVDRIVNADIPEWKGLQRPGALLIHRLKAYQWYSECMT